MGHMPPSLSVDHLGLPDLANIDGTPMKYTHNNGSKTFGPGRQMHSRPVGVNGHRSDLKGEGVMDTNIDATRDGVAATRFGEARSYIFCHPNGEEY
jgi:hypothetical protein